MSKLETKAQSSRLERRLEIEAERKYHYILGQLNINESFHNPDSIRKLSHVNNWANGFLSDSSGELEAGLVDVERLAREYESYLREKKATGIVYDDIEKFIAWKIWEEKLKADYIEEESAKRTAAAWKIARTMRSLCMESIGRHAKTTIFKVLQESVELSPAQISRIADEIAEGLREDLRPEGVLSPLFRSLGLLGGRDE